MSVDPESMAIMTQPLESVFGPESIFIKEELSPDRDLGGEALDNSISSSIPFCALCLRECTPDMLVRFSAQPKRNHMNLTEGQQKLEQILGLTVALDDDAVCRTCWKLMEMFKDFRESCLKAASWTERFAHGMQYDADTDSWLTPEVFNSMHAVHKAIRDNRNRIELGEVIAMNPLEIEVARNDQKKLATTVEFEVQMEDDHSPSSQECEKSDEITANRMNEELCVNESMINQHTCSICNDTFDELAELELHMNEHSGVNPLKCDQTLFGNLDAPVCSICGLQVKNKFSLNRHIKNIHGKAKHACATCNMGFRTKAKLREHVLVHDTIQDKPNHRPKPAAQVKTDVQMTEDSDDGDVSDHQSSEAVDRALALPMDDNHSPSSLECEKCDRKFDDITAYRMHVECCVNGNKKKYYTCIICNATFKELCKLKYHIDGRICTICGLPVKNKFSLERHLKNIHGEAKHACATCGVAFQTSMGLRNHQRVHKAIQWNGIEPTQFADMIRPEIKVAMDDRMKPKVDAAVQMEEGSSDVDGSDPQSPKDNIPVVALLGEDNHNPSILECEKCGKKIDGITAHRMHVERCVNGNKTNNHSCSICNSTFKELCGLKFHMSRHNGERPLKCRKSCGQTFFSKIVRIKHEKGICMKDGPICPICGIQVKNKFSMNRHVKNIHGEGSFSFDMDASDNESSKAEDPAVALLGDDNHKPSILTCKKCGKKTDGATAHRMHVEHCVTGNKTKYHTCSICNATFKLLSGLKFHMNKHNGVRPFKCRRFCDQTFFSNFVRIRHEKDICEVDGRLCPTCGSQFRNEFTLKRHIRSVHGDLKHACATCGKAFPTGVKLRKHMRVHSDERKYHCKICEKAYKSPYSLRIHMRTHTQEKPYACHLCDKVFTYKVSMKSHITRYHVQLVDVKSEQTK